jgi:hypothetical protein
MPCRTGYDRLGEVRPVKDRIGQVRLGYSRLLQVRPGYARLGILENIRADKDR